MSMDPSIKVRLRVPKGCKVKVAGKEFGEKDDKKVLSEHHYTFNKTQVEFQVAASVSANLEPVFLDHSSLRVVDLVALEGERFCVIGHYHESPNSAAETETESGSGPNLVGSYVCKECSGGVIVCGVSPSCNPVRQP